MGEICISGAKNAALPLMAATLLTSENVVLTNIPELSDIETLSRLLSQLGTTIEKKQKNEIIFHAKNIKSTCAPYDLVRKMRASILVLGPLVARFGKAKVSLPGGCAIGARPVDLHLEGLKKMGAQIDLTEGYVHASAPQGLHGAHIHFPKISVGATENILMAACLAKGETRITNAACEPEIMDLTTCLKKMGAQIESSESGEIFIQGVASLNGTHHHVISDRIEAGSYAIAAGITNGDLILTNTNLSPHDIIGNTLQRAGLAVEETTKGTRVFRKSDHILNTQIITEPYPGFPTDLQAQIMTLLTLSTGTSNIQETIFENRFMHVPELARMGAKIELSGAKAKIIGVPALKAAHVMATDLRASISLVLAGLAAKGTTVVHRVYHLDRGYEELESKLSACGAKISRVTAKQTVNL